MDLVKRIQVFELYLKLSIIVNGKNKRDHEPQKINPTCPLISNSKKYSNIIGSPSFAILGARRALLLIPYAQRKTETNQYRSRSSEEHIIPLYSCSLRRGEPFLIVFHSSCRPCSNLCIENLTYLMLSYSEKETSFC